MLIYWFIVLVFVVVVINEVMDMVFVVWEFVDGELIVVVFGSVLYCFFSILSFFCILSFFNVVSW